MKRPLIGDNELLVPFKFPCSFLFRTTRVITYHLTTTSPFAFSQ
jgi:hypothetical protein